MRKRNIGTRTLACSLRAVRWALPFAALLPASVQALSMQVLASEVYIDGGARAEDVFDDLVAESGPNLEIGLGLAVFVGQGNSAVGSSSAIASRKPFNAKPLRIETGTDLRVSARAGTNLDAEAEAIGGGVIRLQLLSDGTLAPGFGFAFSLFLDQENELDGWHLTYHVLNETRGVTAFRFDSDDPSPIPANFVVPVSANDVIRIEWFSQVSVFAENGASNSGRLTFESAVSPIAIPEPASLTICLLGLASLGAVRGARGRPRGELGI